MVFSDLNVSEQLLLAWCSARHHIVGIFMFLYVGPVLPLHLEQLPTHSGGAVHGYGAQQPPCRDGWHHRTAFVAAGIYCTCLHVVLTQVADMENLGFYHARWVLDSTDLAQQCWLVKMAVAWVTV